jgi:hypothetical protein
MQEAIETAHRHLESWNSRDCAVIAETSILPLTQFSDSGETLVYRTADELPSFSDSPPFEVSMAECEVVVSGAAVAVVRLAFRWKLLEPDTARVGNAVWGLARQEENWRVAWRQFVGWRED